MGQDHHFLDRPNRISREQSDVALALYRDHELVWHLLALGAVPPNTPIAFSFAGDNGPFVVVQADGWFVTCSRAGWSTTWCRAKGSMR